MKKKFSILSLLLCVFSVVACSSETASKENPGVSSSGNTQVSTGGATSTGAGNNSSQNSTHTHNHSTEWEYDDDNHYHKCPCGDVIDVAPHSGGKATATEKAICDICGQPYGDYAEDTIDFTKYPHLASMGVNREEANSAYQILVYSFYDSDGDGYGDLKGIEQKLDYIEDLGSNIIWLSPIMPSESYHAYDVLSFYGIDPKIGTLEDYVSLVNAAHEKGIKIVLDMPINHTSVNHEWFVGYLNGDAQYAEYYQEKKPGVVNGNTSSMGAKATFYTDEETGKTYYASFGATMPDLNFQSPALLDAIKDVFEYWVELGADGFRFDAVKHIFDPNEIPMGQDSVAMNNALFQELGAHLKEINPNLYLLGENFSGQGEVKMYAKSFDAEFDFETWHMGLGAVAGNDPWGAQEPKKYYDDTLIGCTNELIAENPNWIPTFMSGNHDVTRAASYFTANNVKDLDPALKLYASMLMLRSGVPFVYYGDELGMYGENKTGWNPSVLDAEIRLPMPFQDSTIDLETVFYSLVDIGDGNEYLLGTNVARDWPTYATDNPVVEEEIVDAESLYNTYKSLIAFRNEHPAIYNGTMSQLRDYNGCATMYQMTYGEETLYVAFNFSSIPTTLEAVTDGTIELLFNVNGAEVNGTNINLSARGVAVFKATGTMNTEQDTTVTSGFGLYVTPADGSDPYIIGLAQGEEFEGFQQYFGDNITFAQGDTFILVNISNGDTWVEDNLNPYSIAGFTPTADGIRCDVAGTYDIYAKFKWEADEIYIGPAN